MNTSRFVRLMVVAFIPLVILIPTSRVLAAQPIVETFSFTKTNAPLDPPIGCGTFVVHETADITVKATTFFDQVGNPIRMQLQPRISGTLSNSITGKSVPETAHYKFMIDLQTGSTKFVGLAGRVTLPGQGTLLREVGNIVIDANGNVTFEAGVHDIEAGEVQQLCAALA